MILNLSALLNGHSTEIEAVAAGSIWSHNELYAILLSELLNVESYVKLIHLNDRTADLTTVSLSESIGHTTAEDELVNLAEEVLNDTDLRRYLRTTHDSDEWTLDVVEDVVNSSNLLLHKETEHLVVSSEVVSNNSSRSMLAVSSTECIHYVAVSV